MAELQMDCSVLARKIYGENCVLLRKMLQSFVKILPSPSSSSSSSLSSSSAALSFAWFIHPLLRRQEGSLLHVRQFFQCRHFGRYEPYVYNDTKGIAIMCSTTSLSQETGKSIKAVAGCDNRRCIVIFFF